MGALADARSRRILMVVRSALTAACCCCARLTSFRPLPVAAVSRREQIQHAGIVRLGLRDLQQPAASLWLIDKQDVKAGHGGFLVPGGVGGSIRVYPMHHRQPAGGGPVHPLPLKIEMTSNSSARLIAQEHAK